MYVFTKFFLQSLPSRLLVLLENEISIFFLHMFTFFFSTVILRQNFECQWVTIVCPRTPDIAWSPRKNVQFSGSKRRKGKEKEKLKILSALHYRGRSYIFSLQLPSIWKKESFSRSKKKIEHWFPVSFQVAGCYSPYFSFFPILSFSESYVTL